MFKNANIRAFVLFFICISVKFTFAQTFSFQNAENIAFKNINNLPLKYPFTGGFNAPQFNAIDLNMDGILDLVVLDRGNDKLTTFLNQGIKDSISYTHKPEYESQLPVLNAWAVFVDFNNDGRTDIFTANGSQGIKIFKNTSTNTALKFSLIETALAAQFFTFISPIYAIETDIPVIRDLDADGDLDILQFNVSASVNGDPVYLFKNLSVEKLGRTDTFCMEATKRCWGRFIESATDCTIKLDDTNNGNCANGNRAVNTWNKEDYEKYTYNRSQHSGSSLALFDMNADGFSDLLVGDIGCNTINLLINSAPDTAGHITQALNNFPQSSTAIDIFIFPAVYFIDVNNDGQKDLLAAPNNINGVENHNNTWLYINKSSTNIPDFKLKQKDFLQDQTIDVGEGANAHWVDIDKDGDKDIIVGNFGYFKSTGNYDSQLALIENIGTLISPEYKWITADWQTLKTSSSKSLYPAFEDIDNDADLDMWLGTQDGCTQLYVNQNGTYNIDSFCFGKIDVGNEARPMVANVVSKNLTGLIIGNQGKRLIYAENTNASYPALTKLTDTLGNLKFKNTRGTTLFGSTALLYALNDTFLAVGTNNGWVYIYKILPNITDNYVLVDSVNVGFGRKISLDAADINADGHTDILVGSQSGGLKIMYGGEVVLGVNAAKYMFNVHVFPNPANATLNIKTKKHLKIMLVDVLGKQVFVSQTDTNGNANINTQNLTNGIYYLSIENAEVKKIVIQH